MGKSKILDGLSEATAFARIQTLIDRTDSMRGAIERADYLTPEVKLIALDAMRVRAQALLDAQALFGRVTHLPSQAVNTDQDRSER